MKRVILIVLLLVAIVCSLIGVYLLGKSNGFQEASQTYNIQNDYKYYYNDTDNYIVYIAEKEGKNNTSDETETLIIETPVDVDDYSTYEETEVYVTDTFEESEEIEESILEESETIITDTSDEEVCPTVEDISIKRYCKYALNRKKTFFNEFDKEWAEKKSIKRQMKQTLPL